MINKNSLKNELKSLGVEQDEAKELEELAKLVGGSSPALSKDTKKRIAQEIGFKPVAIGSYRRLATAGASIGLVLLVIVSQFARPGSALYAIKQKTDEVRVLIQPGFDKEDLDKERAKDSDQDDHKDTVENNSVDSGGEDGGADEVEGDSHGGRDDSGDDQPEIHDTEDVEVDDPEPIEQREVEEPDEPEESEED